MSGRIPVNITNQANDDVCKKLERDAGLDDFVFVTAEIIILIAVARFFHIFLKRVGQPSAVSQMLAGLLVGRTCLSQIPAFKRLYRIDDDEHLIGMATIGSTFFMFLLGLEIDYQFLKRSLRAASFVTFTTLITCTFISAIAGPILYGILHVEGGRLMFILILIVLLANSASPMLIRMMTELKVTMSEVGRIGVSAALINDISCLAVIAIVVLFPMPHTSSRTNAREALYLGILAMFITGVLSGIMRAAVNTVNRVNMKRDIIPEEAIWVLLIFFFGISAMTDFLGFYSMTVAFVLGLAFPRNGPCTRVVTSRLSILVNEYVLPIYFGYAGVQTDLSALPVKTVAITVVALVVMGTIAKVVSTLLVARYLGMQMKEGLVLGLLLNVKGHVELIVVTLGRKYGLWGKTVHQGLLISMLICSITAGPAAAYIVRRERRAIKFQSCGLEWLDLDRELRILTCVHTPHDIPTILDMIQISSGTDQTPLVPYLMHLIEFTGHVNVTLLYSQTRENDVDVRNQNVQQVNAAIDTFNLETGIKLRQLTAVSCLSDMHIDLCNGAQDIHAAIIIVPYHRKLRFDGKMGAEKEGIRKFNQNVLKRAPCTVGILVDRGLDMDPVQSETSISKDTKFYKVVVLFFGGKDDREAVAYGGRLSMHPSVSVTVVRFVSLSQIRSRKASSEDGTKRCSYESSEEFMEVEVESHDEGFMVDFHNRFVATGKVVYIEQVVENSSETVKVLSSLVGMYSLFVVGRERNGPTAFLTTGMSAWSQSEELGEVGDLLALSDFPLSGSVLVVQQHDSTADINFSFRISSRNKGELDNEFRV